MRKVLIWSVHPGSQTGFGTVARSLALGLKAHFEVQIFPFQENQIATDLDGVLILRNPLGGRHDLITNTVLREKPEAVIQVFDLWTLAAAIESYRIPNLIAYSPLDCVPVPRAMREAFRIARIVVPMCRFAEQEYQKVGIHCAPYIYHGVDTAVFYPRNKVDARKALGLPEKSFVVLIVAANGSIRKNLPGQMKAFLRFQQETCPQAMLVVWAYPIRDELNPLGYDLPLVWEQLGGKVDNLRLLSKVQAVLGQTENFQVQLYSAADVLLECTMGEGFGLPVIESMACGTPVIATDFSSLPELVRDSGWLVKPASWFCNNLLSSWQVLPSEDGMVDALREAYLNKELRLNKSTRAAEIASHFDWKRDIIPRWIELINSIEVKRAAKSR